MSDVTLDARAAFGQTLVVIAFRAFPFMMAFSVAERFSVARKCLAISIYFLLASIAVVLGGFDPIAVIRAYGYFLLVAPVPYLLGKLGRRILVFPSCLFLFLLFPAWAGCSRPSVLLILGWDCALSAYSYCTVRANERRFDDYLFFLFVDPTLAYPCRSKPLSSTGRIPCAGRFFFIGTAALFLGSLSTPLALAASRPILEALPLHGGVLILITYASHWGLSILQCGLCIVLGYEAPARYQRPFAATSPRDFWQRWNTYVGDWVRLHVFLPVSRLSQRRLRIRGLFVPVVSSFAIVGILHDLYSSLEQHRFYAWGTVWFVLNGFLVVAWEALLRSRWAKQRRVALQGAVGRAVVIALALVLVRIRSS